MSIQLANALSDIASVSGMKTIEAILGGERDPVPAGGSARQAGEGRQGRSRSLEGTWRADLLFELRQALDSYRFTRADAEMRSPDTVSRCPYSKPSSGAH